MTDRTKGHFMPVYDIPTRRKYALDALTRAEQLARVAKALHVLDALDIVRGDVTRNDQIDAAESAWRLFVAEGDPLPIADQAPVFARAAIYLTGERIVRLAREAWPEGFTHDSGGTRLDWDPAEGAVVVECAVTVAGGLGRARLAFVASESRVMGRVA